MRTRTLLLPAITLTLATITGRGIASGGVASPERVPGATSAPASSVVVRASRILGAWDDARATAWAHGDPDALAGRYTRTSATGALDVSDLRRWRDRGLRVVGLQQQVTALRVLEDSGRSLVLAATDRTVDAVAVSPGRRTALPLGTWTTRRIRLRRVHGRRLVAEVEVQPAR